MNMNRNMNRNMNIGPIEIEIHRENNIYLITMGDKQITTTMAKTDFEAKEWISKVQKIHATKKNKKQPLVIGLWADRSTNYADAGAQQRPKQTKWYNKNSPYELIVLSVGDQCLLWEIEKCCWDNHNPTKGFRTSKQPKVIKDFLSNGRTVVAGLGINNIVKKLESETDLLIPKTVEIKDLMQERIGTTPEKLASLAKINLKSLSTQVLGPEMEIVKPRLIQWNGPNWPEFSSDLVKYASIEAFLFAQMCSKLL